MNFGSNIPLRKQVIFFSFNSKVNLQTAVNCRFQQIVMSNKTGFFFQFFFGLLGRYKNFNNNDVYYHKFLNIEYFQLVIEFYKQVTTTSSLWLQV